MKDRVSLTAWEPWRQNTFTQAPANSGSLYFNYKVTFSIVLLAIVDADYRFLVVDVGSYGSNSDGGIFANSVLGKALGDGTLNVPSPSELTLDAASPQTREFSIIVCLGHGASLKMYLASSVNASGFSKELYRFNQVLLTKLSKLLVHCASICARTEMTRIMPQRMTMIVSKHYKALNIVGGSGHLWRHKMSENCTKSTSTHQQEKLLRRMTMKSNCKFEPCSLHFPL